MGHLLGIFNWLGGFFLFFFWYHTHGCNEGVLFLIGLILDVSTSPCLASTIYIYIHSRKYISKVLRDTSRKKKSQVGKEISFALNQNTPIW